MVDNFGEDALNEDVHHVVIYVEVMKKGLAECGQAWLLRCQHQLLQGILFIVEAHLYFLVEIAEGLDITLDDAAGLYKWILMNY